MIFCLTISPSQFRENPIFSSCSSNGYRNLSKASWPSSRSFSNVPNTLARFICASCCLRNSFRVSRFSCPKSLLRLWTSGYCPASRASKHLRYSSTENAANTPNPRPKRATVLSSRISRKSSRALNRKQSATQRIVRAFLAMPFMALVLFAPVLPLQFPLLNLCTRDRHDLGCQTLETLEWRFVFWRLGEFHALKSITQDLERNAYKSQPPTVAIIKSPKSNLPQSIVKKNQPVLLCA
jgi:hypothetical protein